jgi:hypothetical protein
MTDLAAAIHHQQWELAALYLLLGVTQAAAGLPPEAIDDLLEILEPQAKKADARRQRPIREEGEGGRR